MFRFELGTKARDVVTGVEGVILSRTEWLTGCNTYGLQRPLKENGDVGDLHYTDEDRMESLDAPKVEVRKKGSLRGGPASFVPDPSRKGPR